MSIGKKVPKQDTMEHGGSLGQSPTNSTRERDTTRRPHPHLPPAHIDCVRVSPAGSTYRDSEDAGVGVACR